MQMRRFTRSFHNLQGKLTLSYTLTSVIVFLLVETIVLGGVFLVFGLNIPYFVAIIPKDAVLQATPYFVHGKPDREALTSWLQLMQNDLPNKGPFEFSHPLFLAVVDTQGRIVASAGSQAPRPDTQLQTQISSSNHENLLTVLRRTNGTTSSVETDSDNVLVAMATIVGQKGNVEGALVMKVVSPDNFRLVNAFVRFIISSVIVVTIYASVSGFFSGYLTARGLARRLKSLSAITHRWGGGDFSVRAHDPSDDELGEMSKQLNRMATQLENLLSARQKLATLEERNRLARDLHDSVKQQVFAVAMQIGATQALLKRNPTAAAARLNEAQNLVSQAQQELTTLIRELRPAALEGKEIAVALREMTTQWTQQTGIVATLRVEGHETLPLTIEEALFRVTQEALSNVARHSKATLVQMDLTMVDETVMLSIADNGQGFDASKRNGSGLGLLSMQERMKSLGGDVAVESIPGKGTRLIAHCQRPGSGSGKSDEVALLLTPPANYPADLEPI
jgi:signal transduction histidine kinase